MQYLFFFSQFPSSQQGSGLCLVCVLLLLLLPPAGSSSGGGSQMHRKPSGSQKLGSQQMYSEGTATPCQAVGGIQLFSTCVSLTIPHRWPSALIASAWRKPRASCTAVLKLSSSWTWQSSEHIPPWFISKLLSERAHWHALKSNCRLSFFFFLPSNKNTWGSKCLKKKTLVHVILAMLFDSALHLVSPQLKKKKEGSYNKH